MTDSNRSLSELPGLVAERRRYEGWLVALDARRDTTPAHVFDRVQSDYRTRLARVTEQLEAHRHIIEEERANVKSRLSLLEAEERMRRDERSELDLRAHVGELAGDEAASAFRAVDESIQQLLGEKQGLQGRIDELAALLEERETPPSQRGAAPVAAPTAPVAASAPNAINAPVNAPPTNAGNGAAPQQPARVNAPLADAPPPPPRPQPADASFDELAFLNTVVGAGDASQTLVAQNRRDSTLVRDDRSESPLAGMGDPKTRAAASEAPLAANVTGNNPITLRATANEQTKTLKCNECGGMNYPTEWYCERCGAELAAL